MPVFASAIKEGSIRHVGSSTYFPEGKREAVGKHSLLPLRRSTLLIFWAFHCATVVTSEITDQHASNDALMITL
jgi:hypothetical protein